MCKAMPIQPQRNQQPPFSFGLSDHPADILEGAALVTRFLAEVSPSLPEDGATCGISAAGADGLAIILQSLEATIKAAAERL